MSTIKGKVLVHLSALEDDPEGIGISEEHLSDRSAQLKQGQEISLRSKDDTVQGDSTALLSPPEGC